MARSRRGTGRDLRQPDRPADRRAHTTDTAGQTLATFGIFDLAGLQFSPRIRDIGRLQLYRLGAGSSWRSRYPHAGPLLTQPIQTQLIADHRTRDPATGVLRAGANPRGMQGYAVGR